MFRGFMFHIPHGPLVATVIALLAQPALADGDPVKGEKIFKKCAACHSIKVGAPSKIGPNLHDVVGRTTGILTDFKYSDALLKAGQDGHVWTPDEIMIFVENPKTAMPGTKMTFAGLKKPDERADVVAYLISLHPEGAAAETTTEGTTAPAAEGAATGN